MTLMPTQLRSDLSWFIKQARPNPLIGWNERNQRALLGLLFDAASRTP